MKQTLPCNPKLFDTASILQISKDWKEQGEKIVFTNGCFDILHPGHIAYLNEAKALGSKLILGLNTDDSVKRLNKGPERPLNHEFARAFVLAALDAVDALVLFNEDTPLDLIKTIEPNILVKGGDYDANETNANHPNYIVGKNEVNTWGGSTISLAFLPGFSTTDLVNKIKRFG